MDEVTINVTEVVEQVTINVYPGLYIPGDAGAGLPPKDRKYKSQELAIAGGLVEGQHFWLDVGQDVGVPGTLMIVL